MFGNRQRGKNKGPVGAPAAPTNEPNTQSPVKTVHSPAMSYEVEDSHSLPPEVTETMSLIRLNWDFMTTHEFNPIPYALSFLDGSSLGSDFESFCTIHDKVERAMDLVVDDYHVTFNSSIQKFSSVVDSLADTQKFVKETRENLKQAKELLECRRIDFMHLWIKSLQYKEMSRILDTIVDLQTTVESLELFLTDRRFYRAVLLYLHAEKTVYSSDLAEIEALEGIRKKLQKIKDELTEKLMSELQNQLYLKNASATSRLGQELPELKDRELEIEELAPSVALNSDLSETDLENEFSPLDGDSFRQIRVITKCLFQLGAMKEVSTHIQERIAIDMYHVVDRLIQELQLKHRITTNTDGSLTTEDSANGHSILSNFLQTLFYRFQAVLTGHIYLIDFSHAIKANDSIDFYTKREVAAGIQNEIKALLYDYLTGIQANEQNTGASFSIGEIFKETSKGSHVPPVFHLVRSPEDRLRNLFVENCQFSIDSQEKTRSIEESFKGGLEATTTDKFATVIESGHQLLIPPDGSNILVAFKPTIEFMKKMEAMVENKLTNFKVFLDDFIFNIYLPRIQEQVSLYYHTNINGMDSFQADKCPAAEYPLIKSSLCFILAVHGICRIINSMPVHSDELLRFLVDMLEKYFEKCEQFFKAIMTNDNYSNTDVEEETSSLLSLTWTYNDNLFMIISKNTYLGGQAIDYTANIEVNKEEMIFERNLIGERSIHRSEILLEPKRISYLGNLVFGIEWMMHQIEFLRGYVQPTDISQNYLNSQSKEIMRAFSNLSEDSGFNVHFDSDMAVDLQLTPQMKVIFDLLKVKYEKLADHILFAIRIEIRCRIIYYLDLVLREGNYYLEEDLMDPDQYIGTLNHELTLIEEVVIESLPPKQARFVFSGVTRLMAALLIQNVRYVRQINENGVRRLINNVFSLQQNLITFTLVDNNDLDICRKYYELFRLDERDFLLFLHGAAGMFKYEEYEVIIKLKYEGKECQSLLKKVQDFFASQVELKAPKPSQAKAPAITTTGTTAPPESIKSPTSKAAPVLTKGDSSKAAPVLPKTENKAAPVLPKAESKAAPVLPKAEEPKAEPPKPTAKAEPPTNSKTEVKPEPPKQTPAPAQSGAKTEPAATKTEAPPNNAAPKAEAPAAAASGTSKPAPTLPSTSRFGKDRRAK